MMVWLTSDEHFCHKGVIGHCNRPFADADAMRESLIERHNAVVKPGDDVWHLGDYCLDERKVAAILARENGTHHLVAGNHDSCHPRHKRHARGLHKYLEAGFVEVVTEATLEGFLLHHLPYSGDHTSEDRFIEYRPVDGGRFLLHGHRHSTSELWIRGRMIDVGVDAHNYAPVALDGLIAIRTKLT
jgi:calcineurin-like phosphoesterase family protein